MPSVPDPKAAQDMLEFIMVHHHLPIMMWLAVIAVVGTFQMVDGRGEWTGPPSNEDVLQTLAWQGMKNKSSKSIIHCTK